LATLVAILSEVGLAWRTPGSPPDQFDDSAAAGTVASQIQYAISDVQEEIVAQVPIACVNNPRVARSDEVDFWPSRTDNPKRIAVVGAGIAGMEAAWIAAALMGAVTLADLTLLWAMTTARIAPLDLVTGGWSSEIGSTDDRRLGEAREIGDAGNSSFDFCLEGSRVAVLCHFGGDDGYRVARFGTKLV
jgi:hypothetical protein